MNTTQEAAKAIFLEAVNQPVEDRAAYLDTACGQDAELRKKVEALLASHQQQDSFLDPRKLHPGSGHTQTSDFDSTATSPGKPRQYTTNPLAPWLTPSTQPNSLGRFRHYEVLEELGQGGFGIVYRVFDEKLHRMLLSRCCRLLWPATLQQGSDFFEKPRQQQRCDMSMSSASMT